MTSENQSYFSERELVRRATLDPSAREQLRKELRPYVERATKEFMQKKGIHENRTKELIEVGIEPFDRVFNIYLKNIADLHEFEGYFYKYYIWWMRKAISEYLYRNSLQ